MTCSSFAGTLAVKPPAIGVIAMPVVQPSAAKSPRNDTFVALPWNSIVCEHAGTGGHAGPPSLPPVVPPSVSLLPGCCDDGQPASSTMEVTTARRTGLSGHQGSCRALGQLRGEDPLTSRILEIGSRRDCAIRVA